MVEELDFNNVEENSNELSMDDFAGKGFIKIPEVGQSVTFVVKKIEKNAVTRGKRKSDNQEFDIGLKDKKGVVRRYDIDTDNGVFTIPNWEIYFKLLDPSKGLLMKYAEAHDRSFRGATIKITRLLDGGHMSYKAEDLQKILGLKSLADATAYKETIAKAIKEQRLYDVIVS